MRGLSKVEKVAGLADFHAFIADQSFECIERLVPNKSLEAGLDCP